MARGRLLAAALVAAAATAAPPARVGDGWGTNIHWTDPQPGEVALLAAAFRVARMDFTWASIERTCGSYDFSAYDRLLAALAPAGVRPYWILDYANPCYSPGPGCNTTACVAGFGRFAAAAAAHFGGRGIIWECLNEPNGMGHDSPAAIAALCLAAGAPLAAGGEAFVGPATSGIDLAYLNASFAAGLLPAFTAGVSVHPYRPGPPDGVLDDYAALRSLVAAYTPPGRAPVPIISGEWGYTSAGPACTYGNRQPRVMQGAYAARMWLANAAAGVGLSILYDWRNDGPDPQGCEDNFGSVANLTALKPAYLAARTLQDALGDSPGLGGRLPAAPPPGSGLPPANAFVLAFQPPAGAAPLLAVWHNGSLAGRGQCAGFASIVDCGFYGIDENTCVNGRGCCWAADPGGGPQCYRGVVSTCTAAAGERAACAGAPGGGGAGETACLAAGCCFDEWAPAGSPACYAGAPPVNLTFTLPPPGAPGGAAPGTCWRGLDTWGNSAPGVCSDAATGAVTVPAVDRPLYLLPQ